MPTPETSMLQDQNSEDKLEINLFGVFEARIDGVPVRLPTRRVELILALLALDIDRAISRSHLASLIWPLQAEEQSRTSLRQAIFRLRTTLGPSHVEALEVTPGWLKLRRDRVSLDMDRLEEAGPLADAPSGIPLDGLSGFEPEIEDLLHARRAELRQRFVNWLEQAEQQGLETHNYVELESLARMHLLLDNYDEGALRTLMVALSRQGRRNAALEAFHVASKRIRAELSVEVEPATQALFKEVRSAAHAPAPQAAVEPAPDAPGASEHDTIDSISVNDDPGSPVHLRHVAVMHIVSERLLAALRDADPENAEALSRAALTNMEEAIRREGGKIVGRAGHHVSCVFGAGRPDESPALSAALAAFEIAQQSSAVGLHAGRALIGTNSEVLPLTYVAQTIVENTEMGTVTMTEPVELACRGVFASRPMPSVETASDAVDVWRLSGEARGRGGFDIRKARGLGRFVGRQVEIQALSNTLRSDGPRAAVVIGEPGIGKSRLVHEFSKRFEEETVLRVQFTPGEIGSGFERFKEPLCALFETEDASEPAAVIERLRQTLASQGLTERFLAPLASLLGMSGEDRTWIETPRDGKFQWLADAFLAAIASVSGRNAVLLVEDAHWADRDAHCLLDRIVRSLDAAGPMLVVTQRPGAPRTWAGQGQVVVLALNALQDNESKEMLDEFSLPSSTRAQILSRGEGIPLFIEELARHSAGVEDHQLSAIPLPLQGLLAQRLDALESGPRRLIEAASVIGAEPSDTLLKVVSGLTPSAYEHAVSALSDADLLFRVRSVPERVFAFKHALFQDTANQSIPATRRKALHAAIVAHLEPEWQGGEREYSAVLADHAAKADLTYKAVDFAFAASEDAIKMCAFALADRMLSLVRGCLARMETSEEVLRLELRRLQLSLPVLVSYSDAAGLHTTLSDALSLCRTLGDDWMFGFLSLHAAFAYQHHEPATALRHADAAGSIGVKLSDAMILRESAVSRCQIFTYQGKMRAALDAIADYADAWEDNPAERDEYLVSRYVFMQYMLTRSYAAIGETEMALSHARRSVNSALANNHPIDRYIAFLALGDLFFFANRWEEAAKAFQSARHIARGQTHGFFETLAEASLGRAELRTGQASIGARRLKKLTQNAASLDPIVRLEVDAALACHEVARGVEPHRSLEALQHRAEELDLPLVRIALIYARAEWDGDSADALRSAADAIASEQGYAPCQLPDCLTCASFMAPVLSE
ncbi:AAA family ATPase [uncultured Roseobacter sp.]|uniref:AAA family ATPase n=1 Tax=uncultured Roseobacter sp. TaxID=114847 RepID=UPI0026130B0D|nr:AAA family ATPase [uncultured Roseobacter sp.]